jgi:hypothetical protein
VRPTLWPAVAWSPTRDVVIRPAPGLRRAFSNAYRGACQRGANCLILSVVEPTATIKKVK